MISVIMPVYNNSEYIQQSIDSILSQTEKDFELIIVNDGSTDDSENIVHSYDDPRIVYVKQENGGVAAARNKGLDIAKGELIAWQDADDISLPTRLEIMKQAFASTSVGFAHCDMLLIDEKNMPVGYWQYRNTEKSRLLRFFLKKGIPCSNGSLMFRSIAIEKNKFDTSLLVGSDSDMFFRIGRELDSVHIPKPLYTYRLHSSSISHTNNPQAKAAHVRKLLSRHSLEELVPELDWQSADDADNTAKACAVVSLLLSRRGLSKDANEWLDKAKDVECSADGRLFIRAISLMVNGSYELARQILLSCSNRDHVIENYLGEVAAFMGDTGSAYDYFMSALEKDPYYIEPVDNLRGIGGSSNLQLVDTSWMKYKRTG